ncbi:rod-binding protein [Aeoliella sp.]|uniref:rod-binding protein n=1 Tax=Aeoliella sp. TaxID=2795800 RepID=UPI003CCBD16D
MQIATPSTHASYELPQVPAAAESLRSASTSKSVENAQQVHDAFTKFVGETFFGQMMKSMRSTVEKPAYFHGGRGEEVFQSQLDQQLAQEFAQQSGDRFAEPIFEHQFPEHARVLREAREAAQAASLEDLNGLRRY